MKLEEVKEILNAEVLYGHDRLSILSNIVRRALIAVYEAEMNIAIHSYGGKMHFEIYKDKIVIITEDTDPGIKDLKPAMTEGYFKAPHKDHYK